jgi:translation initiation factor IF-2
MTDTNPSGEPLAPAADIPAPAPAAETPPAAAFGSSRGSGLARGKRSPSAAAPSATPVKADYKPTAVQVITPAREYRNPFASPEPANAPASEPAQADGSVGAEAKAEAQPEQTPPAPAADKPEIQILPPAESIRPAVRWESPSAAGGQGAHSHDRPERAQRDERPAFRPERRPEPYGGAAPGDGREQRRDSFRRQPRDEYPRREQPAPQAPATPAPKGFIGWLKGLFGGAKPSEAPVQERDPSAGQFGEGHRHRRRHRGGRRHGGGGPQGFRGDRGPQGGEFENRGGDRGSDRGGGQRRHRGGRGRDRGGEPRPEGHQGGGAI